MSLYERVVIGDPCDLNNSDLSEAKRAKKRPWDGLRVGPLQIGALVMTGQLFKVPGFGVIVGVRDAYDDGQIGMYGTAEVFWQDGRLLAQGGHELDAASPGQISLSVADILTAGFKAHAKKPTRRRKTEDHAPFDNLDEAGDTDYPDWALQQMSQGRRETLKTWYGNKTGAATPIYAVRLGGGDYAYFAPVALQKNGGVKGIAVSQYAERRVPEKAVQTSVSKVGRGDYFLVPTADVPPKVLARFKDRGLIVEDVEDGDDDSYLSESMAVKKGPFSTKGKKGEEFKRKGYTVGDSWGVERDSRRQWGPYTGMSAWMIYHLPTGAGVGEARTKEGAVAKIEALEKIAGSDWSTYTKPSDIPKSVMSAAANIAKSTDYDAPVDIEKKKSQGKEKWRGEVLAIGRRWDDGGAPTAPPSGKKVMVYYMRAKERVPKMQGVAFQANPSLQMQSDAMVEALRKVAARKEGYLFVIEADNAADGRKIIDQHRLISLEDRAGADWVNVWSNIGEFAHEFKRRWSKHKKVPLSGGY